MRLERSGIITRPAFFLRLSSGSLSPFWSQPSLNYLVACSALLVQSPSEPSVRLNRNFTASDLANVCDRHVQSTISSK